MSHTMGASIAALSQSQIRRFFQQNDSVKQEQCDAEAQRFTRRPVTTTASQGGSSYTVEGGEVVVQFRVPSSPLDMDSIRSIEQAYRGFVPRHEYQGQLGQVHIYTMNNIGGTCMYLARTELQSNNCHLLRSTLDDYARLVNPSSFFEAEKRSTDLASADSLFRRTITRPSI